MLRLQGCIYVYINTHKELYFLEIVKGNKLGYFTLRHIFLKIKTYSIDLKIGPLGLKTKLSR